MSANVVGDLIKASGHIIPSERHQIGPKYILLRDNNPKQSDIESYLHQQEEQAVLQQTVSTPQTPDHNRLGLHEETEATESPNQQKKLACSLQDVLELLTCQLLWKAVCKGSLIFCSV